MECGEEAGTERPEAVRGRGMKLQDAIRVKLLEANAESQRVRWKKKRAAETKCSVWICKRIKCPHLETTKYSKGVHRVCSLHKKGVRYLVVSDCDKQEKYL